ncbi:MAG: hypothetical protein JEZ04_11835 [Spirochaetales bacterium]|nr:hypothetical protein [Spirochaetales bacterium]
MKIRTAAAAALLIILSISQIAAEEINLARIVNSAIERDRQTEALRKEGRILLLQNEIEDYKHGVQLGAGTSTDGLSVSNIGKQGGQSITAAPFAEICLPEDIGASVKAGLPITYRTADGSAVFTPSIEITQDLNKLLGIEKQNKAKDIRRTEAEDNLERRIILRGKEIENELLMLIKGLSTLNKNIITNDTNLFEKENLLENKLRAGMLLRNGSIHLSSLMEIRNIETQTAGYMIEFDAKLDKFYRLTGIRLTEAPSLPLIRLPLCPTIENANFYSIKDQQASVSLKEAEISDLIADIPPQLNLNLEGSQTLEAGSKPALSAGVTGTFEDFTLSLKGGWNESSGGSVTAGLNLNFSDKEKKNMNHRIGEYNLLIAHLNLEIAEKSVNDSILSIETEIKQLESSRKNLEISEAFIEKYLGEMEDKYENGLIREIEIIKARDQKKLIDIDWQILNIDRYLLLNNISTLIKG